MRRLVLGLAALLAASCAARPGQAALDCRAGDAGGATHGYDPALRGAALSAYRTLFPQAKGPPSEGELAAGTRFRCKGGALLVCFVGANLPCGKMNASRANAGADAFCRTRPDAGDVPLFASGHDSLFTYRCDGGRAVVARQVYHLDGQGYATEVWAPAAP